MLKGNPMHIKLSFKSDEDIILPAHYNHMLQGFIYANMDDKLSDFLHNQGYTYRERKFKLFTFSNILNRAEKAGNVLKFGKNISFIISSPSEDFCKSIADSMMKNDYLFLGQSRLRADQIEIKDSIIDKEEIVVQTLSPIVVYSTLYRVDGSKYTCYFTPGEPDYERIITENLIKKCMARSKSNNNDFEECEYISIRPIGGFRNNLIIYKDFIIKGVSGRFILKGDRRLLQMALEAGLGSKNSQGFGCIIRID